eukprot:491583_1
MASAIKSKQDNLLEKANENKEKKDAAAKARYDLILAKAQEMFDKQTEGAQTKYDEFCANVEEDIGKRLKIVRKVIDAEAEERQFKLDQIRQQKESVERAEAERKLAEDNERMRKQQEEKKRLKEEKKKAKEKAKQRKAREKVPLPNPGDIVTCATSKKLYAKLKKLSKAGRYSFCCFYHPHEKKFATYFAELATKYYENVAWFDCPIKDQNFQEAMLLYEFNATPAIVVCIAGKPSNNHRYIIGDTPDNRATVERYAEKADSD